MNSKDDLAPARTGIPVFLIVVPEVIVGHDLAEGVAMAIPGARILSARSLEDGVGLLQDVPDVALAFVAAGTQAFERSALAGALAMRGARVVLMGHSAEEAPPTGGSAQVLPYPFDSSAVEAHLVAFRENSGAA